MSNIKDGGYAFPTPDTYNPNGDCQYGTFGMTLREYFAAKAMQAYITAYINTGRQEPDPSYIPIWAYEMADAMLEAREVQP